MERKRHSQWKQTARLCMVAWLFGVTIVQGQDAVTTLNPGDGSPGYVNGPLTSAKFN